MARQSVAKRGLEGILTEQPGPLIPTWLKIMAVPVVAAAIVLATPALNVKSE